MQPCIALATRRMQNYVSTFEATSCTHNEMHSLHEYMSQTTLIRRGGAYIDW